MLQIYAVSIKSFPLSRLEELLHHIPGCERLLKYVKAEDRIRGLIGQMLIRKLASDASSVPFREISFAAGPYGKPSIADAAIRLDYNISHSGEWVVCAISDAPVGIDVEQITKADLDTAKHFFAPAEYAFIVDAKDAVRQQERFFSVWTAKESYIKALGMGLSHPLDSFSTVADGKIITESVIDGRRWHFATFRLDGNYPVAVCSAASLAAEQVVFIEPDALIRRCFE